MRIKGKKIWPAFKRWLAGLSFRTGLLVLAACVVFYLLSFAAFLLPVSYGVKGALWATFFGLAKAAQYSGLLILGKAGVQRLRALFRRG